MAQETYTLGGAPAIVINNCSGDLNIIGQSTEAEEVTVVRGALRNAVQLGEQLVVEWCDDLRLTVPHGATVVVQRVDGDARIERLATVQVGEVGGDLDIGFIRGGCTIGHVGGDARGVTVANLALGPVGGDVRLEELTGALRLARVDGDAIVRGAVDGFGPTGVGGDLTLDIRYTAGHEYRLDVGGDATVALSAGVDLTLRATVGGDVSELASHGRGGAEARWGEGSATLILHAGGDLAVRGAGAQRPWKSSTAASEPGGPEGAATPSPTHAGAAGDTLSVLEAVARGEMSAAEADDLLSRT